MKHLRKFNESNTSNTLKSKLLDIGGTDVKLGLDTSEELDRMVNDGKIYSDKVNFVRGLPNKCHRNISDRYRTSKNMKIVSGYALYDNVWIQHSWGYSSNSIIESTKINFDKYYGYELTPEESETFCEENW